MVRGFFRQRRPRSFLYVPGDRPAMFDKAMASGADAVIFDLEDAVPLHRRAEARSLLGAWLAESDLGRSPQKWVRIAADQLELDLAAISGPALAGIVLAKCSVANAWSLDEALGAQEGAQGLEPGSVTVVGLVETAAALLEVVNGALPDRVATLGIGEVDLLADLRMVRGPLTEAALASLRLDIVIRCAAAGLAAPVAPTSTDPADLAELAHSTRQLRAMGFRSRTAIHPRQITTIHESLAPSEEEIARAAEIVRAHERSAGGATLDEAGRMVDVAVLRGAMEVLVSVPEDRQS